MREYTLNDIGFTPGKVEELPINFSVENTMNTDEINEQSQKNRQMGEELLRQFEERQKAEVVADVVMETTTKNDVRRSTSNTDMLAAMKEAERIAHAPTVKRYDVEEALVELKK